MVLSPPISFSLSSILAAKEAIFLLMATIILPSNYLPISAVIFFSSSTNFLSICTLKSVLSALIAAISLTV